LSPPSKTPLRKKPSLVVIWNLQDSSPITGSFSIVASFFFAMTEGELFFPFFFKFFCEKIIPLWRSWSLFPSQTASPLPRPWMEWLDSFFPPNLLRLAPVSFFLSVAEFAFLFPPLVPHPGKISLPPMENAPTPSSPALLLLPRKDQWSSPPCRLPQRRPSRFIPPFFDLGQPLSSLHCPLLKPPVLSPRVECDCQSFPSLPITA